MVRQVSPWVRGRMRVVRRRRGSMVRCYWGEEVRIPLYTKLRTYLRYLTMLVKL